MFITKDDLADRLIRQRWWLGDIDSVRLDGEVGSFGHIVVNDKHKIGILITDEEAIMNILMDFVLEHKDCMERAIQRYLELRD